MKKLIRKVNFQDLNGVLRLLYQLSPQDGQTSVGKLERVFSCMLNNPDYYLNVCDSDGELLGTSTLFIQQNLTQGGRPVGHIGNVVVDENFRGKGIDKLLVTALIRVASQIGCYKTIL